MSDGLKVLGLVILLVAIVSIVAALAVGDAAMDMRATCVVGEMARNQKNESGQEVPRYAEFDTVEGAEAFLCLDLPRPRQLEGWEALGGFAIRSHSLDHFEPGEVRSEDGGYKVAHLGYMHESQRSYGLAFSVYPARWVGDIGAEGTCEANSPTAEEVHVQIQEQVVVFDRDTGIEGDPFLIGCWHRDDLRYFMSVEFWGEPDLEPDIVRLLESIE